MPADYTFTAADNGVHTFTVTLVTAGSQTITATDKTNASMLGSATVNVTPAAVDHLVFGQQPTSVAPGAAISPAVTVTTARPLQQPGHQRQHRSGDDRPRRQSRRRHSERHDHRDGQRRRGHLRQPVDQPAGTGYTLVGTLGSMTATSAAFNVAAATSSVIESFDGSRNYYVVGGSLPTASLSTAAKHDGTYGLLDSPGNDWIYRNDAAVQVKQGDTISVWLQFSGAADGRAYFGFGASSAGTLSLVAAPNTDQLLIQNNSGWGYTDIGAVNQTWQANHWYRLEVDWGTSGKIVGKLFDSNGTTLLQTVTASTTAITSGGIAFRATGNYNKFWDTVTADPRRESVCSAGGRFPAGDCQERRVAQHGRRAACRRAATKTTARSRKACVGGLVCRVRSRLVGDRLNAQRPLGLVARRALCRTAWQGRVEFVRQCGKRDSRQPALACAASVRES